jgi:hypothetical protein
MTLHRTRVYVDTSVFGGTQDEEFVGASRHFFEGVRQKKYVVLLSSVTLEELSRAPLEVQRVLDNLPPDSIVQFTPDAEARVLADAYLAAGILGSASWVDANHVAAATVSGADLILSWNFKHIVNYDRIQRFNAVNLLNGYRPLDIRSPWEMEYGNQDQDV